MNRKNAVKRAFLDALEALITGKLTQEAYNARTRILWAHAEALGIEEDILEMVRSVGADEAA